MTLHVRPGICWRTLRILSVAVCGSFLSVHGQVNSNYEPEQWVGNENGTCALLIRRQPLGEERPSLIGFWIRPASQIENAAQDVLTDSWANYRNAVAANVASPTPPPAQYVPDDLLKSLVESLKWFLEQEPSTLPAKRQIVVTKPKPQERAKRVQKARQSLVQVQSYLGDRL